MGRGRSLTRVTAAAVAALAVPLVLPQVAGAVLSGTNGRIVFTSGRDVSDAEAKLHFWRRPATALDPAVSLALTPTPGVQHRHPTWSPNRTQIAYARGPAAGPYDIFIQDLTAPPGTLPVNVTNSAGSEDRPAWSPDGTRLAWQSVGDIVVRTLATGATLNLTGPSATFEDKPAWTPDSRTIFYAVGDPNVDGNIVREPADNSGSPSNVAAAPGISEHQPSVSPDGTKLCFTRGPFTGAADVIVSLLNGGGQTILSDGNTGGTTAEFGDYNCTWSPDGTRVAYVTGTFGLGALVNEPADNSLLVPQTLTDVPGRFDGNPDWAPDGRPDCEPRTVATPRNTPVSIQLACPDTGPAYERTAVRLNVIDVPASGSIPDDVGPPTAAGTERRTYTPRAGFTGTDRFTYNGFDEFGFAPAATVTIRVTAPGAGGGAGPGGGPGAGAAVRCDGRRATIVGTARRNVIRGTRRRDVIAALGGNDVVRGLGGADLICLGAGADRAFGGAGADRILGGAGPDRILGGAGADVMLGGLGNDILRGGTGRDRALGGGGLDACSARLTRSC